MRAARDPQGRRRAIVEAAVEVIAQVGLERATHRAIAHEAGVPLGSTTYYFPTLHALHTEAIEHVAALWAADLAEWSEAVHASKVVPATLSRLASDFVRDGVRARRDYELYVLAARDPALRAVARTWLDGLSALLTPLVGAERAASLSMLVDGALLQAVVTGEPIRRAQLTRALERLLTP